MSRSGASDGCSNSSVSLSWPCFFSASARSLGGVRGRLYGVLARQMRIAGMLEHLASENLERHVRWLSPDSPAITYFTAHASSILDDSESYFSSRAPETSLCNTVACCGSSRSIDWAKALSS